MKNILPILLAISVMPAFAMDRNVQESQGSKIKREAKAKASSIITINFLPVYKLMLVPKQKGPNQPEPWGSSSKDNKK